MEPSLKCFEWCKREGENSQLTREKSLKQHISVLESKKNFHTFIKMIELENKVYRFSSSKKFFLYPGGRWPHDS